MEGDRRHGRRHTEKRSPGTDRPGRRFLEHSNSKFVHMNASPTLDEDILKTALGAAHTEAEIISGDRHRPYRIIVQKRHAKCITLNRLFTVSNH